MEGEQTPYEKIYTVTAWIVDGVKHDVSAGPVVIEVENYVQAEAVVEVNTVYGTTTSTKSTETRYGYLKGSESGNKPSGGTQIGETKTASGAAYDNPSLGIANIDSGVNVYNNSDEYKNCTNRH